ncbi:type II secretion system protein GspH [Zhengella mangrovi]|uniref:Type II secretion system protein GspH n=1 Tax=Zhengella mangrovi TaxID=1982044 RepID=A0A2G1QJB4_9HYPH|nr:prepilin-type N-terminal cleavage/methylation domain-containing protein [Zhengella mangrovi]PHP65579.1 type II secretion system protein GspH [Zhengella mangrovi]
MPARHARRRGVRGFTMLETVAVMAIIAMLASLTLPRLFGGTSRAELRAVATAMTSLLRESRLLAIRTGHETRMTFDTARRTARLAGSPVEPVTVPGDVAISHEISTRCRQNGAVIEVVFLPDGRSCGSQITLSIEGLRAVIRTNWLVGTSSLDVAGTAKEY